MIEGSSDYKKVSKRWFFKEPLTEWFLGTKKGSSMASLGEPFAAPLFLRVFTIIWGGLSSTTTKFGNGQVRAEGGAEGA